MNTIFSIDRYGEYLIFKAYNEGNELDKRFGQAVYIDTFQRTNSPSLMFVRTCIEVLRRCKFDDQDILLSIFSDIEKMLKEAEK